MRRIASHDGRSSPGAVSATVLAQQWPHYAGDQAASHYSPLDQITAANVGQLAVAWEWKPSEKDLPQFGTRPGRVSEHAADDRRRALRQHALQPGRGARCRHRQGAVALRSEGLRRRPAAQRPGLRASRRRGVARLGERQPAHLPQRALPADPARRQDRHAGRRRSATTASSTSAKACVWAINKKHYTNTSPPVVYKDLVIVGNGVGDRLTYKNDPPGDVRAFNARTGKLVWTFHTIPQRGEFGNNTWDDGSWQFTGHTNVWAPMSLDEARGLLYMPVSTPSNDYYGGRRPGQNLFAESLVCLDANTGERKWHFQIVHHGLWDYDPASAPNLVTITVDGKRIDAVVQLTKQGFAFVFDRVTGRPVWPIEERPVPRSDVPGEASWPTQPFPTKPPAFESQGVTLDDAFDVTPELKAARAGGVEEVPARSALHAAVAAGHGGAARRVGRRQLGRRRVRSRDRPALS